MAAKVEDSAAALGQKFLPIQQKVIETLSKAIDAWAKLPEPIQNATLVFSAAAAALGPLLGILGTLLRVIGFLAKQKGVLILVGHLKLLRIAAFNLLGPLGLAVAAAIALREAVEGLTGQTMEEPFLENLLKGTERGRKSLAQLKDIAADTGQNWSEVLTEVNDVMNEFGISWDDAVERVRNGAIEITEAGRKAIAESGKQWDTYQQQISGSLDAASTALAGAELPETGLAEEIVEEVKSAGELAREEAKRIPFEVSQGIIEGRDVVVQAAFQLAEAATDTLVSDQRIKETREKMADLAELTAEEIEAATPATEAARKAELAALEIQLAGYLLRADPMSKEAASLLAKYLKSEDPATQAAAEALMGAVEDRALIMERDVEASAAAMGVSIPYALKQAKREAANEARLLREAVKQHLDRLSYDGAAAGRSFVESVAGGMDAASRDPALLSWIASSAARVAAAARGVFPSSEPKDPNSPLRGITNAWGFWDILAEGLTHTGGAVASAMNSVLSTPALSAVPIAAGGGAAGAGGIVNYNIYLQLGWRAAQGPQRVGDHQQPATAAAIGEGLLMLSVGSVDCQDENIHLDLMGYGESAQCAGVTRSSPACRDASRRHASRTCTASRSRAT